jgi:hypothetical protein
MSANEFLTPINQAVHSQDAKPMISEDSDEIDIIVCFYSNKQTYELTVYPETTIRDVMDVLKVTIAHEYTFINSRTGKQTSKQNTTMLDLGMSNHDQLLVNDDGPVA